MSKKHRRQPLIEQEYERITEEMSGGGTLFDKAYFEIIVSDD